MISQLLLRSAILLALGIAVLDQPSFAGVDPLEKPQCYELRVYTTRSQEQQQRVNDYWQAAGVPAYNRLGIRPVGVFTEREDSPTNHVYVLIPGDSLDTFAAVPAQLRADPVYQQAAGEFLSAPKSNPAYERFESSLLVAFDGMKHLAVPPPEKRPEVFELRTYLSPSENKGWNKIQMFESGEITLMKEIGLAPIFYGRTVAGPHMPCLVYLTSGENLEDHQRHWAAFASAPVWQQLQRDPQYQDNVSAIIRVLLKRTAASQL